MTAPQMLLVDDDRALLQALCTALRLRLPETQVDLCDSAQAALQRLAITDYDVVVSDIHMPGMEGLGLLTQIRAVRPETPTVLITGQGQYELGVRALRRGAYEFIQRPIDRDCFLAAVDRAIRMRQWSRKRAEQRQAREQGATQSEEVGHPRAVDLASPLPAVRGRHVLVVEDNPDGREVLRILLELWGHQVDVAEEGPAAVCKALAERPEVALIDIGLPGHDGYEVARQLRATPEGQAILLIALTGYAEPDDRRRALEAGFDAHLPKPVDPLELARLLQGGEPARGGERP
jgi:CheY-like chemotaxis protein